MSAPESDDDFNTNEAIKQTNKIKYTFLVNLTGSKI